MSEMSKKERVLLSIRKAWTTVWIGAILIGLILGLRNLTIAEHDARVVQYEVNRPQMDLARALGAEYHSHLCEPSGDCLILLKEGSSGGVSGSAGWSVQAWCDENVCQLSGINYNRTNLCADP